MASSKEFRDYILEQLSGVSEVSCRSMMGEYLLYVNGVLFGGIYDDRLLLKKAVGFNDGFGMSEVLPYEGAKTSMYLVDEIDDAEKLGKIVAATVEGIVQTRKE